MEYLIIIAFILLLSFLLRSEKFKSFKQKYFIYIYVPVFAGIFYFTVLTNFNFIKLTVFIAMAIITLFDYFHQKRSKKTAS
jgi:hypothetical protein